MTRNIIRHPLSRKNTGSNTEMAEILESVDEGCKEHQLEALTGKIVQENECTEIWGARQPFRNVEINDAPTLQ